MPCLEHYPSQRKDEFLGSLEKSTRSFPGDTNVLLNLGMIPLFYQYDFSQLLQQLCLQKDELEIATIWRNHAYPQKVQMTPLSKFGGPSSRIEETLNFRSAICPEVKNVAN